MPRGNQTVPKLELRLPEGLFLNGHKSVEVTLHLKNLGLSWLEYLKLHVKNLYDKISASQYGNRLEVMDTRNKPRCRTWSLDDTVKQFLDSFEKNRQKYIAVLKMNVGNNRRRSEMPPPRSVPESATIPRRVRNPDFAPATASPGPSQRPTPTVRVNGCAEIPKRKPSFAPSGSPPKQPRRVYPEDEMNLGFGGRQTSLPARVFPSVNIPIVEDDAASMAETVDSQDSQSDLDGVEIRQIRPAIVKKFMTHVDNIAMIRIKRELQQLMDSGKWLRLTAKIPQTAGFLQLVFLNSENQN